jgi:hypothetical protein
MSMINANDCIAAFREGERAAHCMMRATRLGDWVGYGRAIDKPRRTFRRWLNEARGHVPVIGRR